MYFANYSSTSPDFVLSSSFNLLKDPKKCGMPNYLKALTNLFDLTPKSLYSFISTSEEITFIATISK